jgi:hypothetical protein
MRTLNLAVVLLVVSGCDARTKVAAEAESLRSQGSSAQGTAEQSAMEDRAQGGGLGVAVTGSPMREGRWALADGSTLVLRRGGVLVREVGGAERPVATEVLGLPAVAVDRRRFVFSHRHSGRSQLVATALTAEGWSPARVLWKRGEPDRAALSPDGERVVFAAGNRGVVGLWVIGFDGTGVAPLTNDGLDLSNRVPGQPPAGFVPVPHRGPPEVLADRVRWQAPDGWHEVMLP